MDIVLTGLWKDFLGKKNAQIILSCVKELQEFFGTKSVDTTIVVWVLYGIKSESKLMQHLQETAFYGVFKGKYLRSEIRKSISYLIERGYLRGKVSGTIGVCPGIKLPDHPLNKPSTQKYSTKSKYNTKKKTTKKEPENNTLFRTPEMEQDDRLIRIAEDKLGLEENTIEGIADYVAYEKQRLYWFYTQENHGTEYYPVEFTRHSSQCTTYGCIHHATKVFEGIYKLEWKKGVCFLIGLPECKYIKLRTAQHTITYPTEPFPFVLYTEKPIIKCSFLDEKEKEIF